jgi:hypothetical protein
MYGGVDDNHYRYRYENHVSPVIAPSPPPKTGNVINNTPEPTARAVAATNARPRSSICADAYLRTRDAVTVARTGPEQRFSAGRRVGARDS